MKTIYKLNKTNAFRLGINSFFLFTIISIFSTLNAKQIISYERYRNCGIGCNTVQYNKNIVNYTASDGTQKEGLEIKIHCSGNGWNHCPREVAEVFTNTNEYNEIEAWSVNTYNNLNLYGQNQINNGVLEGNETYTYSLPDQSLRTLNLTWSQTIDSNGLTVIIIRIENVY